MTCAAHGQASGQASLGPGFVQEIEDEQALGKLQFEDGEGFGGAGHCPRNCFRGCPMGALAA